MYNMYIMENIERGKMLERQLVSLKLNVELNEQ